MAVERVMGPRDRLYISYISTCTAQPKATWLSIKIRFSLNFFSRVVSASNFQTTLCMRKQLDQRISTLINNNVKKNHRSFIVLVGDRGRDQVVNLHFLLSQARVSARPSVLWCYKKELGFTR